MGPSELGRELCICIFEHDDVVAPQLAIGARSGTEFGFTLSGNYTYFRREADDLYVSARVKFFGVHVGAPDPDVAWRRLCERLDGSEFMREAIPSGGKWGVPSSYFGFEPLDT